MGVSLCVCVCRFAGLLYQNAGALASHPIRLRVHVQLMISVRQWRDSPDIDLAQTDKSSSSLANFCKDMPHSSGMTQQDAAHVTE